VAAATPIQTGAPRPYSESGLRLGESQCCDCAATATR
jgi:hypothetical protein